MLLAGVLSCEIFGYTVDDLWESIWKKFTFLDCFYWLISENAHHTAGSGPRIIYCITLKLTAEPYFPSFCIHVIKNGFKCPRCAAEQQSLKVSAFSYQNQLFHHSSSQQCWLQQFSWWYFASLVLSLISDHTNINFFLLPFGSRGFFLLFWYFSLQYLNLGTYSWRCLKKSVWKGQN